MRLCGYLPLAIGMLARQLHYHPAWTVSVLAADLASARDRLGMMQAENLSVAAAFDLSYQDLAGQYQRSFRRLGLHPGSDIDAHAAAALGDMDVFTARGHLQVLYDQYLLAEQAPGRYRFHDLIREHARSLAVADPELERQAAEERLLNYFLHTARVADGRLPARTPVVVPAITYVIPKHVPDLHEQDDAVAWMSAERFNLHSAASYAAIHNWPGHTIAIPAAMHGFLSSQGYWYQACTLHELALNMARHTADSVAEAGALTNLGDMQHLTGDYPAATVSLDQALELYRYHNDELGEAGVRTLLADLKSATGDYLAATTDLDRALEIYRHYNDELGESRALGLLGDLQQATGDYAAAIASLTQVLRLHRSLNNRLREAVVLNYLGRVQYLTGDYPAASTSLTHALELHRDLGHRLGEANVLDSIGALQYLVGDYPAATVSLTQALELHRELRHPLGEANALNYLGAVQYLTGDYMTASASLARALELHRGLSNRIGEAEVLNTMGDLALASATFTEAEVLYREAHVMATAISSPLQEARALEGMGRCLARDSQSSQGRRLLRRSLGIYQRIGSPNANRVVAILQTRRF